MTDRQPALLHRLACYVLYRLLNQLKASGRLDNVRSDHRLVFERLLFLCGDSLRTAIPPRDLGLQTVFHGPSRDRAFRPLVHLKTIDTVLEQCVENGWMLRPGPPSHPTNYRLTWSGKRIARKFPKPGSSRPGLEMTHVLQVNKEIDRWEGATAADLNMAVREAAGKAYAGNTVVPHYDMSDKALVPFFKGVAHRLRTAES